MRIVLAAILSIVPMVAAPVIVQEPLRIPMRDGVRLAANLFRQQGAERLPVILVRTPYGKGLELGRNYKNFVDAGYAVVVQDVRGRYESEGIFDPLQQEPQDGDDTLNWIARQRWSNGKIGMMGGSYLGIVQWKAALTGNPYLKAIFPVVSGDDDYRDRFYSPGGAMKLGGRLLWMSANMKKPGFTPPDFRIFVNHLPLQDADRVATGHRTAMFQNAVEHPSFDAFWKKISTRERLASMKVPVFSVGGWYDNFVDSDLDAFTELRRLGRDAHTLIGPWPHNMSIRFDTLDFGPDSSSPISRFQMDWFNKHLRGLETGRFAPIRIFTMGSNQWRDEQEWPLARAVLTPYYFTNHKGANGLDGDGELRLRPSKRAHHDRYTYDPMNPVPTRGGNTCCNPGIFAWGPMDQRPVEKRKDVLVYTSAAVEKDLEVTGPIKAVLYVATSAKDTDFTVKLVDVYPDGRAINLSDGILRLRYRDGLERPVLAEPGKTYAITVSGGVTSNVFRAGHKIRVEIASSNFPHFDRNLNTGGAHGMETKPIVAEQTVYCGGARASYILLPVVGDQTLAVRRRLTGSK